jgi:hypothetical protein
MMLELRPSRDERKKHCLDDEHLQLALQALREDGYVILHDVISSKHIETLRERMIADVESILALDDVPFQFNDGHLQQDPPPFPPYLFRDVLVNDFVVQITRAALGEGVKTFGTVVTPVSRTRHNNHCTSTKASCGRVCKRPHLPMPW